MNRPTCYRSIAALLVLALASRPATADPATETERTAFFEQKIRPVLIEHCLDCHSSETETSGNLSLDSSADWKAGGDLGPAIRPGDARASLLWKAITYKDPDLQMPPDGKLDDAVINDFGVWIDQGALDPREAHTKKATKPTGLAVEDAQRHWSYRPIRRPLLPTRSPSDSSRSAGSNIDRFINQRLQSVGLQTAGPATDWQLIRRVTFDLTGLPPTPEQIDAFLSDERPDAYERLVDRLLASSGFGERFARRWMDVARYAESITLRGFVLKDAWRYRDYLIEAYNRDRPFDQMVRDQIAGDLATCASLDEKQMSAVATGFLALGNSNLEDQDKTKLEFDYIDEQLETVGRAFLGQTIGCARCHDHKFDPIPTRDYYAMAAVMRSTTALEHANLSKWIRRPLPLDAEQEKRFASIEKEWADKKQQLKEVKKRLSSLSATERETVPLAGLDGIVVDDAQARFIGQWMESQSIKGYVGNGYRHDLTGESNDEPIKTATFEPESLEAGTYRVRLAYTPSSNRASNVRVEVFSANEIKRITVNQKKSPPEDTAWVSLGEFPFEAGGQAYVMVSNEGANGVVIADAVQFLPISAEPKSKSLAEKPASGASQQLVSDAKREQSRLEQSIKTLQATLDKRPMYLSIRESEPKPTIPIRIRGNPHQLGDSVSRGFLSAIPPAQHWSASIAENTSGRMAMANWIADGRNPLTARVYANRVWSWLMGDGLVASENNFGTTGAEPTHPLLLDYLATELISDGWSTKSLVRKIVLSDAYQRSSTPADPKLDQLDPDNKWYSRSAAKRLPVESIRDAMLFVAGRLDRSLGGSEIRSGIRDDYDYPHKSNRRSVYWPVFRNSLPPLYQVFDFADTSVSVGQRNESTVATQALGMLNHPWVISRADEVADRMKMIKQTQSDFDATRWVYRNCLGRQPTPEEQERCGDFLASDPSPDAYRALVHAVFASIDFRYLD